ncbi:MAG: hypothetical protein ACRD3M_07570 [Thermoanaerobaculia bacterium]
MKVVGRRSDDHFDWEDLRQLVETAEALHGTSKLVPRGLYRFKTSEEADRWMIEAIARTHARHGRKISSKSAAP